MKPSSLLRVLILLLGVGVVLGIAMYPVPSSPLDVRYLVEVTPHGDFEVELRVRGMSARKPGFRLLKGWGVLQAQDERILDLTATDPSGQPIPLTREDGDGVAVWRMERRPEEAILRYRVRPVDAETSSEASFADGTRFVLIGYSLFLMPVELRQFEPASIRIHVDAPDAWPMWASWPRVGEGFAPATAHDLWSGVATGGDHGVSRLGSGSVQVTVLTESRIPQVMGLTIANRLLPVVREMHDLFGAPPRGDSLRVLALYRIQAPRSGLSLMSGNSEEGAFLCLATPDRFRDAEQLTLLAAHECLHFYLGGAITASSEPPFRNTPDLIWFMEGVTEYLSFKLMERAGLLSKGELAEIALVKDREYRSTKGWSSLTLADAARRMEDMKVYSLVYSRGFLVGFLLDQEMTRRSGPGSFELALRTLFEEYNFYRQGRAVNAGEVRDVFESVSPGTGNLITRFAAGSEKIPPLRVETVAALGGAAP